MKNNILETLGHSKNLIISPDVDGFMSAELLNRFNGSQIVGSYDKNILCLADDIDPEECLFVDCDMNRESFVSIGNHMRLAGDSMSSKSFNPNIHYGVSKYTDKFPYATAFLISFATEVQTSLHDKIVMGFADSTLKNMDFYSDNMISWSNRMDHDCVSYIINSGEEEKTTDNALRLEKPEQSFTSKRYGKKRYLDALNWALEAYSLAYKPIIDGRRYLHDKVGSKTVIRYNKDIVSYAEIYSNEYSVTYDEEIEWK